MKHTLFSMLLVLSSSVSLTAGASEPANAAIIVEAVHGELMPNGAFNVLTYGAAEDVPLSSTGLKEAGMAAGSIVLRSDEIRIFASRDEMNAAPLARIWLSARENGQYWFHTGGSGSAETYVIPKGAAVVFWSRASTTPIAWTNVFR